MLRTCYTTTLFCACTLSHICLLATLWTIACQAPLSMRFSKQEYWSALPFPSAGDILDPGIEPASLMSPELAGRFFMTSTTCEALILDRLSWKLGRVGFSHKYLGLVPEVGNWMLDRKKKTGAFCSKVILHPKILVLKHQPYQNSPKNPVKKKKNTKAQVLVFY